MPKKPEYLLTMHYRKKKGYIKDPETGKRIPAMVEAGGPSLTRAIYKLANTPIGMLKLPELKQLAKPIIREAKLRFRKLEEAGLEESPAYQFILDKKVNLSAAGTDINAIRKNVMKAYDFLHTSTSIVENAANYIKKIETWFPGTTKDERKDIWDAIRRLEDLHPEKFRSYDIEYSKIGKIVKSTGYSADEIVAKYEALIKEAQERELAEARELTKEGRSPLLKGNSI